MPPVVGRLVMGALIFFPLLSALFWLGTPLGLWGAMCLALLMELLPALAVAQLPLLDDEEPLPREPVYLSSIVMILGMGLLAFGAGKGELGTAAMGLKALSWSHLAAWTIGLVATGLLLLGAFLFLRRALGIKESFLLSQLLPDTRREKVLFIILSCSAGLGEELAYRGFLVPALTLSFGWNWGAVLLSSAVFGLLHAYQGWLGVIRTGVLGLVLAASLEVSGFLWPAILAHAILDVIAGVFLGETLVKE